MSQESDPTLITKPVEQPVFPTCDSLDTAVLMAKTRLPITQTNELVTVLGTYHNTLIQEIKKGKK